VATVIYYSGYHPYTLEKYTTPKTAQEKKEQNRFFFWYKRENQDWIRKVLKSNKREDLLDRLLGAEVHRKPGNERPQHSTFKQKHKSKKRKRR